MKLRKLQSKDAPLMLEWMHDESVVLNLAGNFKEKTIEDCLSFISSSQQDVSSIHLAIVSDEDEYMGTVSLKSIDKTRSRAEFAIAIRSKAMGHGYSWFGMNEILQIAFAEEKLNSVYWCVSRDNIRACKFYDKHKFREMHNVDENILSSYKLVDNLKWYEVDRSYFNSAKSELYQLINIRTVKTDASGQLSFVEGIKDIPFEIKRIYYISKVNEGVRRGFHAHKNLKQLLFCPYGKINLVLDDGNIKEEILLSDSSVGILIVKPLWREMVWIENDSILCVLASDYYDESDYIRDYDDFLAFTKKDGK